jgi:hypothetical protein
VSYLNERDDWWDQACDWRWRAILALTVFAVLFIAGKSGLRHFVNPWWFYGPAIAALLFCLSACTVFLITGSRARQSARMKPLNERRRRS